MDSENICYLILKHICAVKLKKKQLTFFPRDKNKNFNQYYF